MPIALLGALLTLGCGPSRPEPPLADGADFPDDDQPLRIAAASDLQVVLPRLIDRYVTDTSNQVAPPTFGASGQLAQQLRQGAPFDLFLAANEDYVRQLADEGVIRADSVAVYARGRVVLVASAEAAATVGSLADLQRPEVRHVAIANPEFAPYGRAARAALEKAGLWDLLQPKLVRAESVRQALQYVATGNAEAGLVGQSIARDAGLKIVPLPPEIAPPIPQAMGMVARTKHPRAVRAFVQFLLGAGQVLLAEHGFEVFPPCP